MAQRAASQCTSTPLDACSVNWPLELLSSIIFKVSTTSLQNCSGEQVVMLLVPAWTAIMSELLFPTELAKPFIPEPGYGYHWSRASPHPLTNTLICAPS